ncbi:MAG: hypothetical protein HY593_05020 [Candidatus Omnitrophica bacterium]|nr:hypothetical protein [Candidatus Omnitrophota bacterium]
MKRLTEKGFTMTELAIATTITLLFALSLYAVFYGLHNQLKKQNVYYETGRSARHSLDRISKDVKEAVQIVSSWGGNSTSDTSLVLKLPSINSNGEATDVSSQFDYVTYKLDSADTTHLVRSLDILGGTSAREGGADQTNQIVGRNVQTILFSSNGTGLSSFSSSALQGLKSINVAVTTQRQTVGTTQTTQLDSDLMLRNQLI